MEGGYVASFKGADGLKGFVYDPHTEQVPTRLLRFLPPHFEFRLSISAGCLLKQAGARKLCVCVCI